MFDYEEKAQKNLEKFNAYLETDERFAKLKVMYEALGDQLITAPASGKVQFHNAFPGGYLDHIVNVADAAIAIATAYKKMGGEIDFTKQELVFSALHHDLGKLGSEEGPYYIDQDSDWHRKRGELYKHNDNIQYFKVPERGLFMLQKYGIEVTQTEWLAIKLSDGLYYEGNKSYLANTMPGAMKTNLPYIIHWADHMASRIETDKMKF